METYRLPSIRGNATSLYEDNVVCIAHIKEGCIKGDKINHIAQVLLHSLALKEWSKCYSTSKIKWKFSRSIHKGIFNYNTQEAHWNMSTQRSLYYAIEENIIMSTWGGANW